MDFETLSRRDLQALCKKNKIPANITNVSMINALKALSSVEGIDELVQQSPGQNNAAKKEPETVQPLTRTRRTTRKTLAKDAVEDTTETPSVVQATTRRARVNSVCRKMDSQLKDCEEEDKKKGALATPVPSGVASRRIRGVKEESVVKREYTTRRSVRLAEKVEVLDEVENEKSAMFKSELFTKDGENVSANFEECLENTSGITGIDANATVEENPKEIDESEVVSAQKHHMQIGEENDLAAIVENLEGNDESESIPVQVQHIHTVKETEKAAEEERNQMSEADDLKLDVEQVLSKAMDVDVNSSVEENLEGNDEFEIVSVKEEQGTDEIYQVTDDSKIDPPSEISLMNEADESAMPESFEGSDSHLNVKPFKEVYARKASPTKNRITIMSDNKENIKVAVKNAADSAKELSDLSVRKLTKMLREKLQINEKNVNEARGRPALQTLPENRMVDKMSCVEG